MQDLRHYFSTVASSKGNSGDSESDSEVLAPTSPKKLCTSSSSQPESKQRRAKSRPVSSKRHYNKKWEREFPWLEYDEDHQGAFCKDCKKRGMSLERTGGTWVTKPFNNWKKALEKMRAHSQSDGHIQSCVAQIAAARAMQEGSIVQQLQQVGEIERLKNRAAIKSLIRCTHFLARHHIAHTTTFSDLVDLVVSCGGEDLRLFIEKAGRNAVYTSKDAVVEFVAAIGQWVEESLLKRLHQAQYFSLMADECTDITTIEELSVFCRWVEDGLPVEHFIEIVSLKKADAKTIYEALVECLKKKSIQLSRLIGMGFDGTATFSGKHKGVQSLLKNNSPHSSFLCTVIAIYCNLHVFKQLTVLVESSMSILR